MKQVNYNPNTLSHHDKNIQYWVTQGIVINGERYSVEEFFVRSGFLYGIITKDKVTHYEYPLSTNVTQSNYDDGELRQRIERLETKPDNKYDDTLLSSKIVDLENREDSKYENVVERLKILENSTDKDNQVLSIEDHTISISNGNSIVIPSYPKYDDSNIKSKLEELDSKKVTLSLYGNTLSISNGNHVEIPMYDDTAVKAKNTSQDEEINALKEKTKSFLTGANVARQGNVVTLTYTNIDGSSTNLEFEDHDTKTIAYDDTALKFSVQELENKVDTYASQFATKQELQNLALLFNNTNVGSQNMFVQKTSVAGYLGNGGVIVEPDAVNKELTSDFIDIDGNLILVYQIWVTTPNGGMPWHAWQFYDADKRPLGSRATGNNSYVTRAQNWHIVNTIIVPAGAKFIRLSARTYEDAKIRLDLLNASSEWTPSPEDV